jgi:Protein of unknown function (DUF3738).
MHAARSVWVENALGIEGAIALVVGKNRPKLKESSPETRETSMFSGLGHLESKHANMARFAMMLSGILGRPVLDNTGIEGYFDIVLDVDPADLVGPLFEYARGSPRRTRRSLQPYRK